MSRLASSYLHPQVPNMQTHTSATQTTLHVTSVATGCIYALCAAMWPKNDPTQSHGFVTKL